MNAGKNKTATEIDGPKTLVEAIRYFSDPARCLAFMVQMRWPNGVCCPTCGSVRVRFIQTRRQWECREQHDKRRFSAKTGTIMEESPLSLDKWLTALWMEVNSKNSISSYEVHRALGVTQKTAWFMQQRIRLAMQNKTLVKIGAAGNPGVEVDETLIGGRARNMHKAKRKRIITGTGSVGKTAVMGLLERHTEKGESQIRTSVIHGRSRETLHDVIH